MPPAAAIAAPAVLGALGGISQSRQQDKYAKEAAKPKPYSSTTTQSPASWLLPAIQEAAGWGRDTYTNLRDNPRLPPTFNQVANGYSGGLPSLPTGGINPGSVTPSVRRAWNARQDELNSGDSPRDLTERERQRIAARVTARESSHPTSARRPGGGSGGSGGVGMSRAGQSSQPSAREQMAQLLLGRAQQPVMGQAQGMQFIQQLLGGGGPDMSALNRGLSQQRQTFQDFRSPDSPINQMIGRGMQGSFSSAAPMQQQLTQRFMSSMSAPPPTTPTSYFDRYFDMAGPNSEFRLFDTSGGG